MKIDIAAPEGPLANDLLRGAKAIGTEINEPEKRVFYLAERGLIPVGKQGGSLIASKSALREHYRQLTQGGVEAQPRMQPQPELRRRSRPLPRRKPSSRSIPELASA
jgi:hypothetical protein